MANALTKIALFFLVSISCLNVSAQNSKKVLDRYFNAVGSVEQWQELKSIVIERLSINYVPEAFAIQSVDTTFSIFYYKRPNLFKYTSSQKTVGFESILSYDGENFMSQGKYGNVEILPTEHIPYAVSTMAMASFQDILADRSNILEYEGIKEIDNHEYFFIKAQRPEWVLPNSYGFDPESGLLKVISSDGPQNKYTYLSDYRDIGEGKKIHFREEVILNGEVWSLAITNSVVVDSTLTKEDFTLVDQ